MDSAPFDVPAGCACTLSTVTVAGQVANVDARELSGLAASRTHAGLVWSHNDSGDTPRFFALGIDGASRGVLTVTGATATDWEDMAIAPCTGGWCLYAADIGDNDLERASVRIYEIDEPAQPDGTPTAAARAFDIAYPDGAHNAEALFVDPRDGEAFVISKQAANPSRVFHMPRTATRATATEAGTLVIPMGNLLVTSADLYADDCALRLLVRTYSHLFELTAAPDASIEELLRAPLVSVPVALEAQGEAVAFLPDGRGYLTVSEGNGPTLSRVACQ